MATAPLSAHHWTVEDLTLEQKIGQLIMVRYPDRDLLREMLAKGWAGATYFGLKGHSAEAVAETLNELQSLSLIPPLLAFGFACTDCGASLIKGNHMRLGATRDPHLAYRVALLETSEQRALGYHIPGLPVLDVNTNPANPIINTRALSDDPALVTALGLAMLQGVMDGRGVTCTMHFPGHGDTADDSHIRLPVVNRSWEELWEIDLAPYRAAFAAGLVNGVCTNHCHYPALEPGDPVPATISPRLITGLLREQMGYDGFVMTDSLTMKPMKDRYGIEEAAILSVLAGHDMILQDYASEPRLTHEALLQAVHSGRLPLAQVDASVRRILQVKEWLGLFTEPLVDGDQVGERVATAEHQALALEVARRAVTVLEKDALPLRFSDPAKVVVLANGRDVAYNADMDIRHLPAHQRLLAALGERVPQAQMLALSEQFEADELQQARELMAGAEVIIAGLFTRVLCYDEDAIGLPGPYAALLQEALAGTAPVVLLSFGNPYVLGHLPPAAGALCTYDEDCEESVTAAVEALFGDLQPTGKLPVRISERYPFGWG